jgi:hypothetical protein
VIEVALRRQTAGSYRVVMIDGGEETMLPVIVRRMRERRELARPVFGLTYAQDVFWGVEVAGTSSAESQDWKGRLGHVIGEGYNTLRDARLDLEGVLGGRESAPGRTTSAVRVGDDAEAGTRARGASR